MSFAQDMIAGIEELLMKWGVLGSDCTLMADNLNDDTEELYDVSELEEKLDDEG